MKIKYLSIFIVGLLLINCTKDKAKPNEVFVPTPCDSIPKSFANDVQPIINNSCVGCHNSSSPAAGYNLENYNGVNSSLTIFAKTINHESGVVPMPYQQGKLSDSLIQVINCWIEDGAKDN